MADRALITMDDLEVAVPTNAAFEAAGYDTTLVSSQDDHRSIFKNSDPDLVILTGALHERPAATLVALGRDSGRLHWRCSNPQRPNPDSLLATSG